MICAEGLKQSAYSYKTILMTFKCFNLYVTIALDSSKSRILRFLQLPINQIKILHKKILSVKLCSQVLV